MKKWIHFGLVGGLTLFMGVQAKGQCILRFSGLISDADTREKLESASIQIEGQPALYLTDKEGRFTVEGLCPGHYDITISHVGCETVRTHIHIKDDFFKEYLLPHASRQLENVTMVGSPSTKVHTQELKGRALESVHGLSLGESLGRINGVTVLQTGSNIYKPVIHGLHSNRVVILNNGIRQESQQWGNEHAPEVDPYIANRISLIKGASVLRYGSDAIGGVVLVEPKLLRATPGIGVEINTAAFSNNRMGVLSVITEGNSQKHKALAWRVQGTVRRGGNARTPDYWLDNSGLSEYNFSLTAGWRKNTWGTELYFSQFNNRIGIFSGSHIGNVTDLMQTINNGQPPAYIMEAGFSYSINRPYQQVQHNLVKSKTFINTGRAGRLNILASWQYNNREEYDKKRFQTSEDVPQLDLSIGTAALDLVWDHFTWKRLRGTIGISSNYQMNDYSRRMFIPNYRSWGSGLFWIEKWEKNQWTLEAGLRYDLKRIFETNTNEGRLYPDRQFHSYSMNLGVNRSWGEDIQWSLSASSNWRPPTINELYSDGLHHGAARLEKGDSSLRPERANTVQSSVSIRKGKWVLESTLHQKWIDAFIYLKPVYPPQLTIRGAFPSFRFTQSDASLSGIDASVSYSVNHHLGLTARYSMLRAWNRDAGEWLIQMPADRLEAECTYEFNNGKKWKESYAKLVVQQVMRQTRTPQTGNIELVRPDGSKYLSSDYAPPPPAYCLLGVEMGTQLSIRNQLITVTVAATNLLNTAYRDYMNAFRYYSDEMGRNISLRMKLPLEWKKHAASKAQASHYSTNPDKYKRS